MESYQCPYCQQNMSFSESNHSETYITLGTCSEELEHWAILTYEDRQFYRYDLSRIHYIKCSNPECRKLSIHFEGLGDDVKHINKSIMPSSCAKKFHDYVPKQILDDYEEAYAILHLSPKASATLSRRCLQGMIRDFWGVSGKNLNVEITQLKDKITDDLWNVIDNIRQLGNIGAHMEKDIDLIINIDPGEAEKLIKLIELLINDWYIAKHNRDKLYQDIIKTNEEKQELRKSRSS